MLTGLFIGWLFWGMRKKTNAYAACAVTGFFAAFFNTVLFMASLVLLFGNTEYVQGLMGGQNVIAFICTFVGINAVLEMIASTLIHQGCRRSADQGKSSAGARWAESIVVEERE